jgi:hypothetical protein
VATPRPHQRRENKTRFHGRVDTVGGFGGFKSQHSIRALRAGGRGGLPLGLRQEILRGEGRTGTRKCQHGQGGHRKTGGDRHGKRLLSQFTGTKRSLPPKVVDGKFLDLTRIW